MKQTKLHPIRIGYAFRLPFSFTLSFRRKIHPDYGIIQRPRLRMGRWGIDLALRTRLGYHAWHARDLAC